MIKMKRKYYRLETSEFDITRKNRYGYGEAGNSRGDGNGTDYDVIRSLDFFESSGDGFGSGYGDGFGIGYGNGEGSFIIEDEEDEVGDGDEES